MGIVQLIFFWLAKGYVGILFIDISQNIETS